MRKHRHRVTVPLTGFDRIEVAIGSVTFAAESMEDIVLDEVGLRALKLTSGELQNVPTGVLHPFSVRGFKGKKLVEEISGRGYVTEPYTDCGDFTDWPQSCIEIHVEEIDEPRNCISS